MKRVITLVLILVCVFSLSGCKIRSMDDIIENEANITGIVKETNDTSILIENETGEYFVSLDVENEDSMTNFNITPRWIIKKF